MRYLNRYFLSDNTGFVPRRRVHTQISCNVGDLSMAVPHERKADIDLTVVHTKKVSIIVSVGYSFVLLDFSSS